MKDRAHRHGLWPYDPREKIEFRLGYASGRVRLMPNRNLAGYTSYSSGYRLGYKVALALEEPQWNEWK
jgi:hypothetical protein